MFIIGRGRYAREAYAATPRAGGPPPPSTPSNFVIFRPGGVASANVVTDWNGVKARMVLAQNDLVVQVDPSIAPAIVPASSGTTDVLGVQFRGFIANGNNPILTIQDGAVLENLSYVGNTLLVQCECHTTSALRWTTPTHAYLVVEYSAGISFADGAPTVPAIVVDTAELNVIRLNTTGLINQSAPAQALISVAGGSTLVFLGAGRGIDPTNLTPAGIVGAGSLLWVIGAEDIVYDFPGLATKTLLYFSHVASLQGARGQGIAGAQSGNPVFAGDGAVAVTPTGRLFVAGCISFKSDTDTTATIVLWRDTGNPIPGAPILEVDVTAGKLVSVSLQWVDAPGDGIAHNYAIAVSSPVGTLTLNAQGGGVTVFEVPSGT